MIRTDKEYQHALRDCARGLAALADYRAAVESEGLDPEIAERLMTPMLVTQAQTEREIQVYEQARNGRVDPSPWSELGSFLIQLRISKRMTQRDLAEELGVDESVVSRDERNEYHGVSKDRAGRIARALGEELVVMTASNFARLKKPIWEIALAPTAIRAPMEGWLEAAAAVKGGAGFSFESSNLFESLTLSALAETATTFAMHTLAEPPQIEFGKQEVQDTIFDRFPPILAPQVTHAAMGVPA